MKHPWRKNLKELTNLVKFYRVELDLYPNKTNLNRLRYWQNIRNHKLAQKGLWASFTSH